MVGGEEVFFFSRLSRELFIVFPSKEIWRLYVCILEFMSCHVLYLAYVCSSPIPSDRLFSASRGSMRNWLGCFASHGIAPLTAFAADALFFLLLLLEGWRFPGAVHSSAVEFGSGGRAGWHVVDINRFTTFDRLTVDSSSVFLHVHN